MTGIASAMRVMSRLACDSISACAASAIRVAATGSTTWSTPSSTCTMPSRTSGSSWAMSVAGGTSRLAATWSTLWPEPGRTCT